MAFFLFSMKNRLVGFTVLILLNGCNSVDEKINNDSQVKVAVPEVEIGEEDTYRKYVLKNRIETKKASAFQYKFGEPIEHGILVYETNYDRNGNILDSIVYNSNKISFHEKYTYNDKNELLIRVLIDSLGVEVQKSERLLNDKGLESRFVMYHLDSIYYQQQREYNEEDELIRLTEFDARGVNDGVSKLVSEYVYNEKGELLSQTELNNDGDILSKVSYTYNSDGNKISISNYNSLGDLQGKTLLKEYENGNSKLIEKYDAFDSLYAFYKYEYNSKGEETKNIILNGIGQVIRQSNTTIDENGNKVLFEIYEGEVGFLGKDEVTYNENGQETELTVFDNRNKQVKRKVTVYSEKGLITKEVNYNKIDEPIYQFVYDYTYFK
jgi:hypothetical protein